MFKKIIKTTFLGCLMLFSAEISAQNLTYTVNLNDRSNDEFKVTLDLDNQTPNPKPQTPCTYTKVTIGFIN